MSLSYRKFLKPFCSALALAALAFPLSACRTTHDELRVLEKSRQVPPAWLKAGLGLRLNEQGIDYVICKDKVLDLPLGLTQAESSVLYNLKFHMFELIMGHLDTTGLNTETLNGLRGKLSQILDTELGKANLRDFYFDKVSVPEAENELIPEYYRIYAFAQVEPKQRAEITERIKSYIKSSPNISLRSQMDKATRF